MARSTNARIAAFVSLFLLFGCCYAAAQSDSASARTAVSASGEQPVSSSSTPDDTAQAYEPTKNAWVAIGLSALVPGAGQMYNEDYWKVPVIWGLGGYWVYEWIDLNKSYQNFRSTYLASISPSLPDGDANQKRLRDFYRDERDRFAWFMGGLYFLNILDAYVGANLYDFDVSSDLGADGRRLPRVTGTIRFRF